MTFPTTLDTEAVTNKVSQAISAGHPVVLTAEEFRDLQWCTPLRVIHDAQGIWKLLGVLGYIGKTPIYDASKWNATPFEAKPRAFD